MLRSHKRLDDEFKSQFLPRSDKYNKLLNNKQVPATNQSLIVIPCLSKTYGFKINQYRVNQKYLKDVMSQKQFNDFVRKANQIVQKELLNKSAEENEPFFKVISILLKICTAVLALGILLLAIVVYSSIQGYASNVLLYFSLLLFVISGVIAGLCPFILHGSSYKPMNYESIISEKLRQLQSQENRSNISRNASHIIWRIQNNFYWIELHINRMMLGRESAPHQSSESA